MPIDKDVPFFADFLAGDVISFTLQGKGTGNEIPIEGSVIRFSLEMVEILTKTGKPMTLPMAYFKDSAVQIVQTASDAVPNQSGRSNMHHLENGYASIGNSPEFGTIVAAYSGRVAFLLEDNLLVDGNGGGGRSENIQIVSAKDISLL